MRSYSVRTLFVLCSYPFLHKSLCEMDIHKCAAKNVGFMVARLIHKSLSQSYDFDAFVLAFVLHSYPFLHKSFDEMDEYEMRSYSRSYSFYINPCAKTIFLRSHRLGF